MTKPIMPAFVFERLRHIEIEAGFILAGHLVIDFPEHRTLRKRDQRWLGWVIRELIAMTQSGSMPDEALIYGWPGDGGRPANAVDTADFAVMTAWANRSLRIGVRIDPRTDGLMRIDSDMLAQLELGPATGESRH